MYSFILQAQASAVDMATPFTLAVVVLVAGVAGAFGAQQMQANNARERIADLERRMTEREKHGGTTDAQLASMSTTLARVDTNVEKLLLARHPG